MESVAKSPQTKENPEINPYKKGLKHVYFSLLTGSKMSFKT